MQKSYKKRSRFQRIIFKLLQIEHKFGGGVILLLMLLHMFDEYKIMLKYNRKKKNDSLWNTNLNPVLISLQVFKIFDTNSSSVRDTGSK